jgi:hypothetical protein
MQNQANLFNFFDRAIPSITAEPIRKEWPILPAFRTD